MLETVGCCVVDIACSDKSEEMAHVTFLYPTRSEEQKYSFGSYLPDVVMNAPPVGSDLPLLIISHGLNGAPWAFRDLAANLAKAKFVVGMPEHRDRNDTRVAGGIANLEDRPRYISRVIDAALADPVLKAHVSPSRIAVIGHSVGSYTALCLAGGRPWAGPTHHQIDDGRPREGAVEPDRRVRAAALLAPSTFWFEPDESLKAVSVPIFLRVGEDDPATPLWHAERIFRGVSTKPENMDFKVVPHAGHFSFMSKFPPDLTHPDYPPSQDPPGFDRTKYQQVLFAELRDFLLLQI